MKSTPSENWIARAFVSKLLPAMILAGPVILFLIDVWYKPFRYIEASAPPIPQAIRALILAALGLYVLQTGLLFGKKGFRVGLAFNGFALLWFSHWFIGEFSWYSDAFFTIRSLLFVVFSVATYRLYLSGVIQWPAIRAAFTILGVVASVYAVYFMVFQGAEAGQNAGSYIALWCLPFALQMKNWRGSVSVAIMVVGVLITIKRGPAVALALGFMCFMIVAAQSGQLKVNIRSVLSLALLVSVFAGVLVTQGSRFEERFERLSKVNTYSTQSQYDTLGSGRVRMARVHMENYYGGTLFDQIFGFGNMEDYANYGRYRRGAGVSAHSTWVETLHNYGVLGTLLLIGLFLSLALTLVRLIQSKHILAPICAFGFSTVLISSVWSSVLFSPATLPIGVLFAVASAEELRLRRARRAAVRVSQVSSGIGYVRQV